MGVTMKLVALLLTLCISGAACGGTPVTPKCGNVGAGDCGVNKCACSCSCQDTPPYFTNTCGYCSHQQFCECCVASFPKLTEEVGVTAEDLCNAAALAFSYVKKHADDLGKVIGGKVAALSSALDKIEKYVTDKDYVELAYDLSNKLQRRRLLQLNESNTAETNSDVIPDDLLALMQETQRTEVS